MRNVSISGAKNAALPVIATTLLQKNLYYITNVPLLSDTEAQIRILKQFNVKVNYINRTNLTIDTTELIVPESIDYSNNIRGVYYFIGATTHCNKPLELALEKGCDIGARNIDYHVHLLEMAGKNVALYDNKLLVRGKCTHRDITYVFPKPSVGATLNAMLMFSHFKSRICLVNYAKDPYIINTLQLLQKLGVHIQYDDESIVMDGKRSRLVSNTLIKHAIIPDPVESLTYIIYAGMNLQDNSRSHYTIGPIHVNDLGESITLLESTGIFLLESGVKDLYHVQRKHLQSFHVSTYYYPSIYTDIQPFLTLLALCVQNGTSTITENVWNDRFRYLHQIKKFGYHIDVEDNTVTVEHSKRDTNVDNTHTEFQCTDLRGGMALLLLMRMHNVKKDPLHKHHIDRGYSNYENNIRLILENSDCNFFYDADTKQLSNIHIGGSSKYYLEAFSEESILNATRYCLEHGIRCKMVGNGNNIYFAEYYDGMVIKNNYKGCTYSIDKDCFRVSSGTPLLDFVLFVADYDRDVSKLAGIPGLVGGAVYGNAGAYGVEIGEIVESCEILSLKTGTVSQIDQKEMDFQYRNSALKTNGDGVILTLEIKIKKAKVGVQEIKRRISETIRIRHKKYPTENTLGSVFKNVVKENSQKTYAWVLLDELQLRGVVKNHITVYEHHPNIFLNHHNASPKDFQSVVHEISNNVFEKYKIRMEPEIEYIV
jgi:UDP-N-acetylglucosamine 1-carboxyvinyltransferase